MVRSSRDPRRMSPRSARRDRSFSRLAVACLRVISNDDTYNANDRQDILKQKCSGQTDGRSVKRAYVKECGIPNGPSGRFCSTKHVGQATPHENKKLMSGILRRKVAIARGFSLLLLFAAALAPGAVVVGIVARSAAANFSRRAVMRSLAPHACERARDFTNEVSASSGK